MDDASVDLAIMADSLEKTVEPLWEGEDEEEPPQDNIFLIMKDFEQKKVRADAVKQALHPSFEVWWDGLFSRGV